MKNDKKNYKESNELGYIEYKSILDKLIHYESNKREINYIKIIICVFGGIIATIFSIFICIRIYQNDFTVESLLSVLLAFFSMFIAIFFYFKADEANSRFYDSSYNFMKDVSVTLGKIEERFGEKLNSMNEKLNHIESVKQETKQELKTTEDEKDVLINELLEKANMSQDEKERFKSELIAKEQEAAELQSKLMRIEMENRNLNRNINGNSEIDMRSLYVHRFFNRLSESDKKTLILERKLNDVDNETVMDGIQSGILDSTGKVTSEGRKVLLNLMKKYSL